MSTGAVGPHHGGVLGVPAAWRGRQRSVTVVPVCGTSASASDSVTSVPLACTIRTSDSVSPYAVISMYDPSAGRVRVLIVSVSSAGAGPY